MKLYFPLFGVLLLFSGCEKKKPAISGQVIITNRVGLTIAPVGVKVMVYRFNDFRAEKESVVAEVEANETHF